MIFFSSIPHLVQHQFATNNVNERGQFKKKLFLSLHTYTVNSSVGVENCIYLWENASIDSFGFFGSQTTHTTD